MANFNLTQMAVNMFCPGNVVQLDDAGLPSILVYIPAFKNSDVLTGGDDSTHPAFIVNGRQIPGFYYSKYENVVYNGKAYSLPAEDPTVSVDFEAARECCEGKGYGWHLSTAAEWAAIALWCKANGFLPYGNNNNGKDSRESEKKAIPTYYNSDGTIGRVATGTGPLTWSHDNTPSGIWDLNGNAWEQLCGIRTVWGELQILANNDAADPDNPQNATSVCWKAINAADGSLVDPECSVSDTAVKTSGSTVKLDYVSSVWTFSTGISNAVDQKPCYFGSITCTNAIGEAAKIKLRALALLPDSGSELADYENDQVWLKNQGTESVVSRGGRGDAASTGIFAIHGYHHRMSISPSVCFRAAYIPNI